VGQNVLDIKLLRDKPKDLEARLKTKDPSIDLGAIIELDAVLRGVIALLENLQAKRNALSKEIGVLKARKENLDPLMQEVAGLGSQISTLTHQRNDLEEQLNYKMACLPNIPSSEATVSLDPKDNVFLTSWGDKPAFDFPFKNHVELNDRLQLFDFKRAAKTSGSGWPAYKNLGAKLEWALLNYMLDTHIQNGFEMWLLPHLVRSEIMYQSGQLPKFENQQFKVKDDDYDLYLIPTAETVLNGLHGEEIFDRGQLPKKYVAYTPCFRREAGAAGSQERGLIRTHQFNKVEMFAFVAPEDAEKVFSEMVKSAEQILRGLKLHYRNMFLVTGDMSFAATKTVDIEVWLPGQDRYYEVSSVSNCTDFQARRSKTRYRKGDEKLEFVYTLNGSGLATSRLMVALLENNQQADGSVVLPEVLHKYLNGAEKLCPVC
jgi:seryl-tRNA synthetase